MNHGCVTLDEVFAAAAARAASLVPETSGYLALAIGDASSRLPLSLDERAVLLTTEGSVTLSRRGEVVSPRLAACAMRDLLARLLSVSSGTMPGLAGAARPREESERGVDGVVEEIEAALIPVNRAAARRALARLSRETLRAKEAGKLRSRPAQAPKAAPRAAVKVAAPPPPPRERTPIPPPELVSTPSAPRVPVVEAAAPAPVEHDLAPFLTNLPESAAPPASAAGAPAQVVESEARPSVQAQEEPPPCVVITEPQPVIAEEPIEAAIEVAVAAMPAPAPVEAAPLLTPPPVGPSEAAPLLTPPPPAIEAPVELAPPIVAIAAIVEPEPEPAPAIAEPEPSAPFAELAEPTPTVLGMSIEIDDAPTPIDAMPATSLDLAEGEQESSLEAEVPLAPSMPVTMSAAPEPVEPRVELAPAPVDPPLALPVLIAEPIVAEPIVAEPIVAEPIVAEPIVAEPIVAEPIVAEKILATPLPAPAEPLPLPIVAQPRPVAPEPVKRAPRPILSGPRLPPSSGAPTRADALLASFTFSSGEDTMMTATAVSLKKLALDPTPPPPPAGTSAAAPARFSSLPGMDRLLPSTSPPPVEAQSPPLTTFPTPKIQARVKAAPPLPAPAPSSEQEAARKALEEETPVTRMPAVAPRRARPGLSVLAAIVAGTLAGLVAVARLRPDLVTSLEERIGPTLTGSPRALASPAPPAPPAPAPDPAPSPPAVR